MAAPPAPQAYSAEQQAAWLHRVNGVQTAKLTPAQREMIQERSERMRQINMKKKCVKKMKSKAVRQQQHYWGGMQELQEAPTKHLSYDSVVNRVNAKMDREALREDDDDSDDEPLERVVSSHEMDDLLKDLRAEPPTEEEQGAKFQLYEKFQEKVEAMRGDLFNFWGENKDSFQDAARGALETKLRKIDDADNMGIQDQAHVWFVYLMVTKVDSNIKGMEGILKDMERKLDMLANMNQEECPVCLEKFGEGREGEVLACCHMVCKECWQQWKQLKGPAAFCPLCRNTDFVAELTSMAG